MQPLRMDTSLSYSPPPLNKKPSTLKLNNKKGSVASARAKLENRYGCSPNEVSIYTGVSDRPLGWKRRKTFKRQTMARETQVDVKRWDGRNKTSEPWECLRRVRSQGEMKSEFAD